MTANLHPYAVYRPSGVWWLGHVPEHWEVRRLRSVAAIVNGATPSTNVPTFWDGDIIWLTPEDLGRLERRHISDSKRRITTAGYESCGTTLGPPGSVAISTRAPIGHLGILTSASCVNQGCRLLVPVEAIRSDYLYYEIATARPELESIGQGSTFTEISRGKLGGFLVAVPPSSEQAAIVRYLDYVDRRVRRYVSAKERLISLLEEERQAVINRAVTRGLDPNAPLRPSGVEWLGDVPEHWDVIRNGQLFVQRNETGFPELPILEVSLRTGVRLRDFRDSHRKQIMSVRSEYKRAVKGDVAYNMMRMWQGAVGVVPTDGLVSPAYVVAKPRRGTEPRYFSALFRTTAYMVEVDKNSRGIVKDRNRLYWEDFKQMPTPYPPLEEQVLISDAIDRSMAAMNDDVNRMHRQIDLIQEYRIRLIADVVTGKLDVRAAAAGLPNETDDRDPIDESGRLAENVDGSVRDANEAVGELATAGEVTV